MANLSYSDLRGANLSNTDLTDANLYKVNADGVDFTSATLTVSRRPNSVVDFSSFPYTSFQRSSLVGVNFSNQTLDTAAFYGSDITNADFSNTVLSGLFFMMENANSFNSNSDINNLPVLSGINVSGSDLSNVVFGLVGLTTVITSLDGTLDTYPSPSLIIDGADFSNVTFGANTTTGTGIGSDILGSLNLSLVYFKNTTFEGAIEGNGAEAKGENLTCPDGSSGQTYCIID